MEKEKLISFNENQWHYKLMSYVWDIDPKMFKNLCPYFWLTVASILVVPFVFIYRNIVSFCKNIVKKISNRVDKILYDDFRKWVSTLSENQVLYFDENFYKSSSFLPSAFRKQFGLYDAIYEWRMQHKITEDKFQELKNKETFLNYIKEINQKETIKLENERKKECEKAAKSLDKERKKEEFKKKYNKIISYTKAFVGFVLSCLIGVLFLLLTLILTYILTGLIGEIYANYEIMLAFIITIVGLIGLIILGAFYYRTIEYKFEKFLNKQRTSFKEKIIILPAVIAFCIYKVLKFIFFTFIYKWIIKSTINAFKIFFIQFTGIFGEYFNASYSDYCPGIEWDENEKE